MAFINDYLKRYQQHVKYLPKIKLVKPPKTINKLTLNDVIKYHNTLVDEREENTKIINRLRTIISKHNGKISQTNL